MTTLPIQSAPSSRNGFPPLWPPIWPPLWRPLELQLGVDPSQLSQASAAQAGLSNQAIPATASLSAGRAAVRDSFSPAPVDTPAGNLYSDQLPFEATRVPPGSEIQVPLLDQRIALAQWQTQQDQSSS